MIIPNRATRPAARTRPTTVTPHARPIAKRSNKFTTVCQEVSRRVRVRFEEVSGQGSRNGFPGMVVAVERTVYSAGSGETTVEHWRSRSNENISFYRRCSSRRGPRRTVRVNSSPRAPRQSVGGRIDTISSLATHRSP